MLARLIDSPKKRIIAGVVAAAVLVGGVVLATSGGDDEAAPAPTSTSTTLPTTTTTVPPQIAPLTGLAGDYGGRINRPAVFVKIDNAPQARPQSGLVQADIVFEERVEGNTTRLAAVFHSSDAVEIGPVRSTRSTDLTLVPLFGRPIYASSGGNPGVLSKLAAADVVDVGHNIGGAGFRRHQDRRAPHNLFTSLPELYAKAPEPLPPPPLPLFSYRNPGEALTPGARPAGGVALSFGGPEVSRFKWDALSKRWLRYHGDQVNVDPAGVEVAPKNVVVLETPYDFSGANGNSRPHGELTGEGRALVFTDGNVIEGKWVRPSPDALQLLAADGTPIELTPGQTFIELIPPGDAQIV